MLDVVMLNVVMLNVVVLNVIILNITMLSVINPTMFSFLVEWHICAVSLPLYDLIFPCSLPPEWHHFLFASIVINHYLDKLWIIPSVEVCMTKERK
jgi:hypothetical protein